MTTENRNQCGKLAKFALCTCIFLAIGSGVLWWTQLAHAQGELPVEPAQSDSPD